MSRDLYREVTDEIDAREILRYLNDLGIRNVSGEILKDFITDLKRVIKYDLHQKSNQGHGDILQDELRGPERLHSASTFSSRNRSKINQNNVLRCTRGCNKNPHNTGARNVHSAPLLNAEITRPSSRRVCSCPQVSRKQDTESASSGKRSALSSNNFIKVPIKLRQKKSDPVSLYHYYLSVWEKYKDNLPGQNSWADLRWSIRQKLAGDVRTSSKKSPLTPAELEKREKGWVE